MTKADKRTTFRLTIGLLAALAVMCIWVAAAQAHHEGPDQTHHEVPVQTHHEGPDQTHHEVPVQTHHEGPDQVHHEGPDQTHHEGVQNVAHHKQGLRPPQPTI